MSMLDGFFSKGFKGSRCKTLLKLTIPRIKLIRNRKEIQLKQMRKDIARLLETGQEATARIRVEHIIREEKMMAAHEIIELFCELINARLPIIETQKEVPLDLKEAISTICFAAPRCGDLPELLEVQMLFGAKYGKEFVQAATELMPDCGVNRQIITLLSVRAPPVEDKMKLLKEIAEEHKVEWDPADTEAELLKPHEDLLSGPSQFISGSKLPLPKEKHDESIYSSSKKSETSQHDHEADLEMLDFPEVPRTSLRPGSGTGGGATNPILPPPPPPPPFDMGFKPVTHESGLDTDKSNQASNLHDKIKASFTETKSFMNTQEDKGGYSDAAENIHASSRNTQDRTSSEMREEKPVFLSGISPSTTTSSAVVDTVLESKEDTTLYSDKASSAPLSRPTLDSSLYKNESQELPIPFPSAPSLTETPRSRTMSSSQRNKSSMDVDFQDVLLAAQNAADSADRAAAAARAAATLAQTKISELSMIKKEESDEIFGSSSNRNVFAPDFTDERASHDHGSESAKPLSSSEMPQFDWKFSDSTEDDVKDYLHSHQPQRSSSLEDDPYDSYPNLFSSQTSKDKRIDP